MRGPPTITSYVTTHTPISHDITLDRRIGWAATILLHARGVRFPAMQHLSTLVP